MKKAFVLAVALAAIFVTPSFARPHSRCVPRHRTYHRPTIHHPRYHHSTYVSPWLGLTIGSFVGAYVANSVNTASAVVLQPVVLTPVVVQAPVVVQLPTPVLQVWVEGKYVDQVLSDGTIVRVWQPGHWETK